MLVLIVQDPHLLIMTMMVILIYMLILSITGMVRVIDYMKIMGVEVLLMLQLREGQITRML